MKLKDTKRKYDLFYVDDYVYFDNTVYKIVYSEGYIGYGYDIFKNKPTWEEDIVAINFEDDFEFIDRKRSTLPFNEVFFKGDKTVYFDEYSNRTEVNRYSEDKDNKELAILYVIAKSKGIHVNKVFNYQYNSIEDTKYCTLEEVLGPTYVGVKESLNSDEYNPEPNPVPNTEISKYIKVRKTKKAITEAIDKEKHKAKNFVERL